MNYQEFMEKYGNNLNEIRSINFSSKDNNAVQVVLSDDPEEYVDIASQCNGLRWILLEETETSDYYNSIVNFVGNCNEDVRISNFLIGSATKEEFLRSEQKINEILKQINPEWTTKQKVAYVHYEMGKLISYAPDFVFNGKNIGSDSISDFRNIWKSIDSGVSVCNGVTFMQRTILSRMGIKTRELSSGTHSFLLVETEDGNIITDATWDLDTTLFEACPMYFGKTYEQLREIDGPFCRAHKLEEPPEGVIEISEEELREIFYSIGLTNEDRTFKFPILRSMETINSLEFNNSKKKIDAFLKMFTQDFSMQATHLSETRSMIEQCIRELGILSKDLTTKFVYDKEDEECKRPYLCIHINDDEMRNVVRLLNLEQMQFENVEVSEFDHCYKMHNLDTRDPFWKKYLKREEQEYSIEVPKDRV